MNQLSFEFELSPEVIADNRAALLADKNEFKPGLKIQWHPHGSRPPLWERSEEEIQATCRQIKATWSPGEEERRRMS